MIFFNEGNETNIGKISPIITELSLLQDKGIGSDIASFLAVARALTCPHKNKIFSKTTTDL